MAWVLFGPNHKVQAHEGYYTPFKCAAILFNRLNLWPSIELAEKRTEIPFFKGKKGTIFLL